MNWALSADLRERIVRAYEAKEGSYKAIAQRFSVSESSVYRLIKRHREDGTIRPRERGGGNPARIGPQDADAVLPF